MAHVPERARALWRAWRVGPTSWLGAVLVVALLGLGLQACGTTHVVVHDPHARVYVDGVEVGTGVGELTTLGTPGSVVLSARTSDGREARRVVRREFTWVTLLGGFVTYGICLFACWEYPDLVMLELPPAEPELSNAQRGSGPSPPSTRPVRSAAPDPWLLPPPGWQPPTTAGTSAPPASTSPIAAESSSPPSQAPTLPPPESPATAHPGAPPSASAPSVLPPASAPAAPSEAAPPASIDLR